MDTPNEDINSNNFMHILLTNKKNVKLESQETNNVM